MLKGVILSIEDTLCPQGELDQTVFNEVTNLIRYLTKKNIQFVVFTNRKWTYNKTDSLERKLKEEWGEFPYFCRADNTSIPPKPRTAATQYILNAMGWQSNEVVYIGSSENDMRTAVNGGLLFFRATWWANKTDYGFEFDSPKDIARFIDTFCLRDHLWCHQIHDGDFEFYALAPFSTMKQEYNLYSGDARAAAKHGQGHPNFWIGALVSSLYFSGIHSKIDYIAVYPGHEAGSGNIIMDEAISVFGKCFRKKYLPDLILRHTTATKSQTAKAKGFVLDHTNQLNTIRLNKTPQKSNGEVYVNPPLSKGKRVLLIDDICTRGYSLESARAYIEQTGSKVIMATWLKTINTDIQSIGKLSDFDPYKPNTFSNIPIRKTYNYAANILDHLAPGELTKQFSAFTNWEWPD